MLKAIYLLVVFLLAPSFAIATQNNFQEIISALETNNQEYIKEQIKAGFNLNSVLDENGDTALNIATEHNHINLIKLLLSAGADDALATNKGWTPLMIAVDSGFKDAVNLLSKNKAAINSSNDQGWTALHFTVNKNNKGGDKLQADIAKLLIKRGARVDEKNKSGNTALMIAAMGNRSEQVKVLLKEDADPSIVDNDGWTPLMAAAYFGANDVVNLLAKNKDVINKLDKKGFNALHHASQQSSLARLENQVAIAKVLIKNGVNVNHKNENGTTPLLLSTLANRDLLIKTLLDAGADATVLDSDGWTPLMIAVNNGHLEAVSVLVKNKESLNIKDKLQWTALHFTANQHNKGGDAVQAEIATLLVKNGAEINAKTNNGNTAILLATYNNRPFVLKALLASGADASILSSSGWSALMIAVNNGYLDAVSILATDKKSINAGDKDTNWSALHFSVNKTNHGGDDVQSEIIKTLLKNGAHINAINSVGNTPLQLAVMNKRIKQLETLIAAGADATIAGNDGWTPLMNAVEYGFKEGVERLAQDKRAINFQPVKGLSALHIVANNSTGNSDQQRAEMAQILLKNGANIKSKTELGNTPLIYASMNGHKLLMQTLIQAGADPLLSNNDGLNPLMFAVANGHKDLVEILAKNKSLINARDNDGETVLHFATRLDSKYSPNLQLDIAQILIENGAFIDVKNNKNQTPLMIAAARNKKEIITLLLNSKANASEVDNEGWTPLMYAILNGQEEAAKVLAKSKDTINLKNKSGWSALHFTSNQTTKIDEVVMVNIAKILIQNGALVDSLNYELVTPLQLATMNNKPLLVNLFLEKKADIFLKNKFERTAEDEAKKAENWNIVALLREHAIKTGAVAKPANPAAKAGNSSLFPAAPAKRPGVTTCNTRCNNGDCYRTYDDGRQVRFQAQRKYNTLSGQWEFDSGSC